MAVEVMRSWFVVICILYVCRLFLSGLCVASLFYPFAVWWSHLQCVNSGDLTFEGEATFVVLSGGIEFFFFFCICGEWWRMTSVEKHNQQHKAVKPGVVDVGGQVVGGTRVGK